MSRDNIPKRLEIVTFEVMPAERRVVGKAEHTNSRADPRDLRSAMTSQFDWHAAGGHAAGRHEIIHDQTPPTNAIKADLFLCGMVKHGKRYPHSATSQPVNNDSKTARDPAYCCTVVDFAFVSLDRSRQGIGR